MRPACDLAACVEPFERRLGIRVDHEAAVLVVEDGIREQSFTQRVDPARTVPAQHVREGDVRVAFRYPGGVEVDSRPAVWRLDAFAFLDLLDDRLAHGVARPERVRELLAVGVQEDGAVRARRLGNRVALHVLRPGPAVRVVLQCVEVAHLGTEVDRDLRHLAGRARMVRRQLAAFLGDSEAPPARCEDHRRGDDRVVSAARAPAVLRPCELGER